MVSAYGALQFEEKRFAPLIGALLFHFFSCSSGSMALGNAAILVADIFVTRYLDGFCRPALHRLLVDLRIARRGMLLKGDEVDILQHPLILDVDDANQYRMHSHDALFWCRSRT